MGEATVSTREVTIGDVSRRDLGDFSRLRREREALLQTPLRGARHAQRRHPPAAALSGLQDCAVELLLKALVRTELLRGRLAPGS